MSSSGASPCESRASSPSACDSLEASDMPSIIDSARSFDEGNSPTSLIKAKMAPPRFSVTEKLSGATVLLTGSTGYIGKLVLESLFRTCPGIRKVYLIIRASKDRQGKAVSPEARLDMLLRGPEFANLQKQKDSVVARISVISADLTMPGFGMSDKQALQLKMETNYIIHCAASIRFDEPISDIMRTNYASTSQLLELASSMPFLRCFTYMSTAYVNSNLPRHSRIEEEIYPLPGTPDPLAVAQDLLDLPPSLAEAKAQQLMRQWKLDNTYFVAKNLSERLVMSYHSKCFPVCIVRPSLVGCVAAEPFPGYIGNSSGFTAMILGSLAGIIKFIQHNPKHTIAVVPGDVVAAATLVATVTTASMPGKLSNVVHICSSDSYPLMNRCIHSIVGSYLSFDPVVSPNKTLVRSGNYSVDFVRHRSTFRMRCISRKVQLATLCAVLKLTGASRHADKIMMAHGMWTKLGSSKYDYNFTFVTNSTAAMYDLLPAEERSILKTVQPVWREDLGDSWIRYLRTYTAGVKHIYLKESPLLTDQQDYSPR